MSRLSCPFWSYSMNDTSIYITNLDKQHALLRCKAQFDEYTHNVIHRTSELLVNLTASRIQRDMTNMDNLDAWLQTHDPFNSVIGSMSMDLTAGESDNISYDDAEVVGQMIQNKLYSLCFEVATIKRSDPVHTLKCIKVGVKVDKTVIHIDPLILFTCATLLLERQYQ